MAAFEYLVGITGDCSNTGSGIINVSLSGGVPPYIINFINPNLGTGSTKTNLNGGVYTIRVNDSLGDVNNEFYINATVSSGGCLNVSEIVHTTCGENNGSITVSGTSSAYPISLKLYSGNTLVTEGTTSSGDLTLGNLPAGIFQAYYEDSGGCSGYSESIIIKPSEILDFGFYSVNDTQCFGSVGKLQITGLTGNAPYTYLWYDGSTGTTITGLTAGTYSVTVTDSGGCTKTKVGTVNTADALGLGSITATTPTCFSADGTITLTITGGTGPYFYSGSNGTTLISYAQSVVFTGFTSGPQSFVVTDATLCNFTTTTYLQAAAGFTVVSVNTFNSTCSSDGGSVTMNLLGNGPFTYTLVRPDASTVSTTEVSPLKSYSNLSAGTYSIIVSNTEGCSYTEEFTIFTEDKFNVTLYTTGTTCGSQNGICYVEVGTGYTGILDFIITKNNSPIVQYIDVTQTATTFNNLSSGIYRLEVRDQNNCSIYRDFTISTSNKLDFGLAATNCGNNSSGGTITTTIFNGTPPFTYSWSSNVNGQTGPNLTNLTGGTYTLTIVDYSGCTTVRSVVVPCNPLISGYKTIPVISSGFTVTTSERDFSSMVYEGFYDLTTGNTNCVLSSATYTAFVEISGNTYEQSFYTGATLNDVPSESLWVQTLESIISGVTGVSTYTLNLTSNSIIVQSSCDGTEDSLSESEFIVGLTIDYDINCET
jgi:hypothetical protein